MNHVASLVAEDHDVPLTRSDRRRYAAQCAQALAHVAASDEMRDVAERIAKRFPHAKLSYEDALQDVRRASARRAHTEGYWYLIDEDEGDLLIVPDQDDKFIQLRLDEQPE